jgi:hypothetical protein
MIKDLLLELKIKWRAIKIFYVTMIAFFRLYDAGFRISHSETVDFDSEIFRFWWGKHMIKDMADIDRVGKHWNTIRAGHVERLRK